MKLITVFLLAAALQVSANGHSQGITFSVKNATLSHVFSEIKKQTGYTFIYTESMLQESKAVSLTVNNSPLEQTLQLCFAQQPFTYSIIEKTVVVKPKKNVLQQGPDAEIITITPSLIDIKGRVVNENGEPMIVFVTAKGTNNATSTDADGYFILKGVDENATLVITGVSVETREIKVNGKNELVIAVQTKVTEGEDIVVKTNYWETKKMFNPGNISKVLTKDIEKNPVSNPIAAIQARVPGLQITQQTGIPGGNFQVRIRGTNSILNGNDPLYVIDGVPFYSTSLSLPRTSVELYGSSGTSPLNSINPSDIESLEVLKDADATAIYGSRGANGVILITTKKGKPGKTKVDFGYYAGIGKITRELELLDRKQYLQMRREAFMNDNIVPTTANAPDLLVWDTTRSTDWQKELIGGTANYMDAQIAISGGDKNTQFVAGGGFHRETTVFPGDNADRRISARFNLMNSSANQKLKTNLSANYSSGFTNLISQDITIEALTLPPNAPALFNQNGELSWMNWTPNMPNPLGYTIQEYEGKTNNLIGNLVMSYRLVSNLEIRANFGYTHTLMESLRTYPLRSLDPSLSVTGTNTTAFSRNQFQSWIAEPQINWNAAMGKGQFSVSFGASFIDQKNQGSSQYAEGYSSESLMKVIGAAPKVTNVGSHYRQYRYNAVFSRINYQLADKYIINITARRDGSSRFGPGKQFANFGAAGMAWIFSKEKFIEEGLPFLSFGKLRFSYGSGGNDQIGDYQYLDAYTSTIPYQGIAGLGPVRLYNPAFAWEVNRKLEGGLEAGILNNRIQLGFSYYRNRSSNQLVGRPLPGTAGFASIQANLPATVQNTGIEIELNALVISKREFKWTSTLNMTVPDNKLLAFPDLEKTAEYVNTFVVGEPLQIKKLYHYTGIDNTTGIYEFEDVDGNGVYNTLDKQTVRFIGQEFYGGFHNNFQYKRFQLDFLFQFVKQQGFNALYYTSSSTPGRPLNQITEVLTRWQKSGDVTDIQKYSTLSSVQTKYNLLGSSDRVISDASFVRLKNIHLSYSFLKKQPGKSGIENFIVFVQAQNLLTITKYKGLDPETQSRLLPPLRVLAAGIHLTF